MAEQVFIIEVVTTTGRLLKWFKGFDKYKYRFRIVQWPGALGAIEGGQISELGISKAKLDLFRLNYHSEKDLQTIGEKLTQVIFGDNGINTAYNQSLGSVRNQRQNKNLSPRLRLMFCYDKGIGNLIPNIPWECIYHDIRFPEKGHFGISQELSVARLVPKGDSAPLSVSDKLIVMGVAPNPYNGYPRLDVDKEIVNMKEIADRRDDRIQFCPLPDATWSDFCFQLSEVKPHVLIFTGHNNIIKNKSYLIFQNADATPYPVSVSDFVNIIRPQVECNLRVVVLSACQTAASGYDHPFASAALRLIDAGVPAVIAMQSKVFDDSARQFNMQFFTYLLQGYSIDSCVNAGRAAMLESERVPRADSVAKNGTQWAIPVLYLATREDGIFEFDNTDVVRLRTTMEEKFPLVSVQFINRPSIHNQLEKDFAIERVTVLHGPFGAGKTQIISNFSTWKIHTPSPGDKESDPLFFYLQCRREWETFDKVLQDLNRQGEPLKVSRVRRDTTLSQSVRRGFAH